eukprot:TRINITY_DN8677_c0_g1_i5.p1 TRINITY_DN8677_c0_g1~~TRINITY_DN8677_c0_g1_i5.p1  ORF type:complete len:118 (-),score=3.80 TRINITY_DN8677_c0_g1_i5:397-750(-)
MLLLSFTLEPASIFSLKIVLFLITPYISLLTDASQPQTLHVLVGFLLLKIIVALKSLGLSMVNFFNVYAVNNFEWYSILGISNHSVQVLGNVSIFVVLMLVDLYIHSDCIVVEFCAQ